MRIDHNGRVMPSIRLVVETRNGYLIDVNCSTCAYRHISPAGWVKCRLLDDRMVTSVFGCLSYKWDYS